MLEAEQAKATYLFYQVSPLVDCHGRIDRLILARFTSKNASKRAYLFYREAALGRGGRNGRDFGLALCLGGGPGHEGALEGEMKEVSGHDE